MLTWFWRLPQAALYVSSLPFRGYSLAFRYHDINCTPNQYCLHLWQPQIHTCIKFRAHALAQLLSLATLTTDQLYHLAKKWEPSGVCGDCRRRQAPGYLCRYLLEWPTSVARQLQVKIELCGALLPKQCLDQSTLMTMLGMQCCSNTALHVSKQGCQPVASAAN